MRWIVVIITLFAHALYAEVVCDQVHRILVEKFHLNPKELASLKEELDKHPNPEELLQLLMDLGPPNSDVVYLLSQGRIGRKNVVRILKSLIQFDIKYYLEHPESRTIQDDVIYQFVNQRSYRWFHWQVFLTTMARINPLRILELIDKYHLDNPLLQRLFNDSSELIRIGKYYFDFNDKDRFVAIMTRYIAEIETLRRDASPLKRIELKLEILKLIQLREHIRNLDTADWSNLEGFKMPFRDRFSSWLLSWIPKTRVELSRLALITLALFYWPSAEWNSAPKQIEVDRDVRIFIPDRNLDHEFDVNRPHLKPQQFDSLFDD